ncbi:DUF2586 family protein [Mucilaginibacter lappiensis]|uniref:Mu-like prophage tail sheath protein gpL n=1 Tax=Mucilaginibacter lappiensis TaxID=354630 RepID=A0A841JU29_9SPHI|nr:DUF2586 family protein [Mucilaginibacter lappiensis]MBB6131331.1 hypothetical protein [Mucilaginibacter lappiensis]
MRPNVTINKLNGKLGRRNPNTDAVFAMVLSAPEVAGDGNLKNGVSYALASQKDAIAIGVTAAYDTANTVLVYHHIDRFFTRNPNATLYFLTAPQTAALADMANVANAYAKKLLRDQQGKVKYVGIGRNPAAGYEPVLANGLDSDVVAAVANAQALYQSEFTQFRYASFLIEGRSFNGTAAAAKDLRTLTAPNVSVTIAADPAISNSNAAFAGYAALGDVLGLISLAAVSQDPGELDPAFNLQNTGLGLFTTAGLSSNQDINSYVDADLDQLNDKGYIFPDVISGLPGFYLSDSHTCSAIGNNDYAYIENNRTIEKAIFLARTAILPKVKSRLKVDPSTGQLEDDDRKALETTGKKALEKMQDDGDISGGIDCYVDPEQNVLATSNVNVEIAFTPLSIGRQIVISIGFSNPFKS